MTKITRPHHQPAIPRSDKGDVGTSCSPTVPPLPTRSDKGGLGRDVGASCLSHCSPSSDCSVEAIQEHITLEPRISEQLSDAQAGHAVRVTIIQGGTSK